MTRRTLAAAVVALAVLGTVVQCRAQSSELQQTAATPAAAQPAPRILEKDPSFATLLNPPSGEDFLLLYSKGYQEKAAEIEAKAADITDENLRKQARDDEWAQVPKRDLAEFKAEADMAYYDAKIAFLKDHPDYLFVVGRPKYDDVSQSLIVKGVPETAVDSNIRLAMSVNTIKQIYEKFGKLVEPELDAQTRDYVSKAGAGSMCAMNKEWCYSVKRDEVEDAMRASRLVVAGQGDFDARKITRLLLVDYETETELQELNPQLSAVDTLAWRFTTDVPPPLPPEPPPVEPQPEEAKVESAPPTPAEAAPASDKPKEDTGNTAESAPQAQSAPQTLSSSSLPPNALEYVPGTATGPMVVEQPPPQYPAQARANHVQGDVVLRATIDKEGKVTDIRVLSGDDLLAPSAVEAVRKWKYEPRLINGVPTEAQTTITITFSLDQ